jgi:hypothetical protein
MFTQTGWWLADLKQGNAHRKRSNYHAFEWRAIAMLALAKVWSLDIMAIGAESYRRRRQRCGAKR